MREQREKQKLEAEIEKQLEPFDAEKYKLTGHRDFQEYIKWVDINLKGQPALIQQAE